MRTLLSLAVLSILIGNGTSVGQQPKKADAGVLPVGVDGKPLNLDFETGTLKDWTLEGEAFKGQPIKGDTVFPRRNDNRSQHQGDYWIGGYEKFGDKVTGTLTSVAFKVTHPWASFLVGGGPHEMQTCVEIVNKESGNVIFRSAGMEEENLRRVAVDLKGLQGKEIFIRVVDKHTAHWGHVNFDDFRFHQTQPKIAPRPKAMALDVYKHAGLKPEEAAKAMTVPPGFEVKLFAGEPDVHQPIAMCIDHRGRLWVVEAYTYPRRHPHPGPVLPEAEKNKGDKIVIFEDADGDGKFDKRTVFMEGLNLVSGIELGFGGVWVGAAPYFLFIPHDEKTDKPGEPKILLDGWGYQDTHETLNSFIWGPDGWLYGCHGVFTHSVVGKPGDPEEKRTKINAGIWRYHPTKHVFEVFAHGTSNPWGLDYNANGDFFCEACVIPHMWHIIQGGRYARQANPHFNPYTYDDIKTIAVHRHFAGATPHGGNGRSDEAGGGHAHCGLMCYQGGTWPKEYHGKLFMGNLHGHRINVDVVTPKGSGYVADRNPDFLLTNDAWSIPIAIKSGPDGNVYMIDWYDKQICHLPNPNVWDRTNGRIYKICHKDAKVVKDVDLKKLTSGQLIQMLTHTNEWYVRQSRQILQERFSDLNFFTTVNLPRADKLAFESSDETHRLRALWLFFVHGHMTSDRVKKWLQDTSPQVRAWTVRLVGEDKRFGPGYAETFAEMAQNEKSPVVRLALASLLQKLPLASRARIANPLIKQTEDVSDHNLPLMLWYAIEPLADLNAANALHLTMHSANPMLTSFMVRRIASAGTPEALAVIVDRINTVEDESKTLTILRATNEALKGRRLVAMPDGWSTVYAKLSGSTNAEVRSQAESLAVTFGDAKAFAGLRKVVSDIKADVAIRQNALASLLGAKDKELAPILQSLLKEVPMRSAALKGLAAYDDAKTPAIIFTIYPSLNSEEKRDALNTLASRPAYAKELLIAIEKKSISSSDVSADIVRAMMNLNDPAIEKQIGQVWGIARRSAAERVQLIAATKKRLTAKKLEPPDLMLGRALYQKTCAQCHTLYGVGGKISPDLTGSNRANLDYILENVLDPSAVIPKEYTVTIFEMDNGRKITGILKEEAKETVKVQTANELLILPKNEIESRKSSDVSMMPDDILKTMSEFEFRSLIAYLQHPQQMPMLATAENAKDLFNGKDLTGWYGDPKLWKVENGEIVGTSPGIKHNEFLKSHMAAGDFKLTLQVKLTPNKENSGIQFRSEALPDGEVKGYQADAGQGWWGKLYEERGRALLWDMSGEEHVKKDDWNEYVVIAKGSKIQTFINGKLCVDLDDPKGNKRGIFAFQIHSGGAMQVRYKDLKLEVNPK
jgi:putative membrane-bound dehydrogenase-like protein